MGYDAVVDADFADRLVDAMGWHRHWERVPVAEGPAVAGRFALPTPPPGGAGGVARAVQHQSEERQRAGGDEHAPLG